MKHILLFVSLLSFSVTFSQYNDPNFPIPISGYGSDGSHTVGVISFANPNFPTKNIEIYHPTDLTTKVPTIFYSHAYGGNVSANISGVLNFIAKKGYAVVYVPYQTTGVTNNDRYTNLIQGFKKAARDYSSVIDTTRVGFMGHSFGGGASFTIAYQCFTQYNWGSNGRFIYALAQWYNLNLSQTQLQSFPSDVKLLTEVFDDDVTNDHRMAVDIFNNINISNAEKDYILLKSSTVNGYNYVADHSVPNTSTAFDALDYYAYYRLLDALCDYTFNGNLLGKDVALGNGSSNQITMPTGMQNLQEFDSPPIVYLQSKYTFPCSDNTNPRIAYCIDALSNENFVEKKALYIYPNPVTKKLNIANTTAENIEVSIYTILGQTVLTQKISLQNNTIDVSSLNPGIYFLIGANLNEKFIKQ